MEFLIVAGIVVIAIVGSAWLVTPPSGRPPHRPG